MEIFTIYQISISYTKTLLIREMVVFKTMDLMYHEWHAFRSNINLKQKQSASNFELYLLVVEGCVVVEPRTVFATDMTAAVAVPHSHTGLEPAHVTVRAQLRAYTEAVPACVPLHHRPIQNQDPLLQIY